METPIFSCGSSGDKYLSLNETTKIQNSIFVFTGVKARLAPTTELHSQMRPVSNFTDEIAVTNNLGFTKNKNKIGIKKTENRGYFRIVMLDNVHR